VCRHSRARDADVLGSLRQQNHRARRPHQINSGARQTIECNNGNLRLDGDNNTYTVTGHCRRLEVFGSANHVAVDSADIISAFGNDNSMTYHSGYPTINKTGNNNTISQRQAPVG
jgi:hypothetical protein